MIDVKKTIHLFTQYGFDEGEHTNDYLVFISKDGYFRNVEIVVVNERISDEEINKAAYEEIGFSVRIRRFDSMDSIHAALFQGFFNIQSTNRKTASEYQHFCKEQENKIGSPYGYVSGSYYENGLQFSSTTTNSVVNRIVEYLTTSGNQLVILEASAGFGKTCTSYEVINELITRFPLRIPLLAELSKNRAASIFRYVLLSEIDQKFSNLSSELVISEIHSGNIILIVDGFDELLSKEPQNNLDSDKSSKEAQTMLDTIANLFPEAENTKILLTTRKSSIFVGDTFENWVDTHLQNCNVTRIQLSEPSLKDWIGFEKAELLRKKGIEVNYILNPVLLSVLRNEDEEVIQSKYTSNDSIIEKYLDLLLQRERRRQDLRLSKDEQLTIMSFLAAQMVQFDISSDSVEFIGELLDDAIENTAISFFDRYNEGIDRVPTRKEFIAKLSHHALLDRVSMTNNNIGFINDFIFGEMIIRALKNSYLLPKEISGKYLDLAVTTCSAASLGKKRMFYDLVKPQLVIDESAQRRLNAIIKLSMPIEMSFEEDYFDSLTVGQNIAIISPNTFVNCVFSDCIFIKCTINSDAFYSCLFQGCSFFDCDFQRGVLPGNPLMFFSCTGHQSFLDVLSHEEVIEEPPSKDYARIVLEQFWMPGYDRAVPKRAYETIFKGVNPNERQEIANSIDQLLREGILEKKMHNIWLNFEKIARIKEILHR